MRCLKLIAILAVLIGTCQAQDTPKEPAVPALQSAEVVSTLDAEKQPILYWVPENAKTESVPLLVFLHSWSGDVRQDNRLWQAEAVRRGWAYLHPNFRGMNNTPKACGSKFARQDILDAVDFLVKSVKIDPQRIYLAGTSGGGHMAMLMAGNHPERFSAVSAWVGIGDMAEWYRFHAPNGKPDKYAGDILKALGGPPGESEARDQDYTDRSPVSVLHRVDDLPLDIMAGVHDGHTGSVPVAHSLQAFNVIARSHKTRVIEQAVIDRLWESGKEIKATPLDKVEDADLGRTVILRRSSRAARVTIFEGGHEGLAGPACQWLSQQRRATRK